MVEIRKRRQLTPEEKFQIYNEATTEISLAQLHMGVLPQIGLFFLNVDH